MSVIDSHQEKKPFSLVVYDANGSVLTPAILVSAWVTGKRAAADHGQRIGVDAAAYMSKRQYDQLLYDNAPTIMFNDDPLKPRPLHVYTVPIEKHPWMQDDLVTMMDSQANIFAQIKNLAPPREAHGNTPKDEARTV